MGVHETSREGGSLPYCLSKEEKGSNPNVKNREMGQRNEDYNYWDIGRSCKKNWNVVLGNPQRNNSVMFGKEQEKHWGCGLLPQPVWSVSCCCLWWAMVAIFCIQNHPKGNSPGYLPLQTSPLPPTTKLPRRGDNTSCSYLPSHILSSCSSARLQLSHHCEAWVLWMVLESVLPWA